MANYTHEFSQYPNKLITLSNYKDVDDSVSAIINQINTLRAAGNYNDAALLIAKNSNVISQYCIGADAINKIVEEIRNTQIKARTAGQQIFVQAEEPTGDSVSDEDVWIGDA